ncbi:MAG: GNAT family N-acetyltransferase [Pseudomonadota bacterium]
METERLILREWQESDILPFIEMNRDLEVMKYFPALFSADETRNLVVRIKSHFREHGFGLFAVELKSEKKFIGFVGLAIPTFEAHFTPAVEIGWRFSSKYFGQGYATEAAKKVLEFAFEELKLKKVVSFTTKLNQPSINVMKKLGMTHDAKDDFQHPKLDKNHPLSSHVLYRIKSLPIF